MDLSLANSSDYCKIIIAEDDPDDRFIEKKAFLELGFSGELLFFQNGDELINYLKSNIKDDMKTRLPELILLDLKMPKKDGIQSLEELKKSPDFSNIPVIMLTTSSRESEAIRCLGLGAHKFITKPASYKNLVELMDGLIKKYCGRFN